LNRYASRKIKRNYFLNYTKLSQKSLNKFLLKNKSKTLIRKYYFLLSKNQNNTLNKENYFLNYVNLAKCNSSVNTYKKISKSNIYESALKKNTFFSTRRYNNKTFLLQDNKVLGEKRLAFIHAFYLKKTRIPRRKKNFINKLRSLHKLFLLSNMYNLKNNVVFSESSFLARKRQFLLKNLHKILKNKSHFLRKMNYLSKKGLRILKKARKNKNFLFRILK